MGTSRWFEIMGNLTQNPEATWWDDQNTPEVEDRDQIFVRALNEAVRELENTLGSNVNNWTWGDLHTLTLSHGVMDNFPLINSLFNRGPFQTSGGSGIVNATGWRADQGYYVRNLPSMRMIVELGNLQNSLTMHTTGQSGHAYHPHYVDMTDPWRLIQYHPMHWERTSIETDSEAYLRMAP